MNREPAKQQPLFKKFYFEGVKGLGNVAVSRHAQGECARDGITQTMFENVLRKPVRPDIPGDEGTVWRERDGIRLVIILRPTPFKGACLVKTAYKIEGQEDARRRG